MDIKLGLLIAVLLSAFGAAIITTDKLRDKRFKWYKSITLKGWIILLLYSVITGVSLWQYDINDNETKEQERKQDIKDSINAAKIIDNNRKTASILSETLGKYGYALDSANKKLVKLIKDSAKVKRIMEDVAPILSFGGANSIIYTKTNDYSGEFNIDISSFDASSTDFNLYLYLGTQDSLENIFMDRKLSEPFSKNERIPKNAGLKFTFNYTQPRVMSMAHFILYGTYGNSDKSKKYNCECIYTYDFKTKTCGIPNEILKNKVMNKFKETLNIKDYYYSPTKLLKSN